MTASVADERVLNGRSVLITRAPHQTRALASRLSDVGAVPVLCPLIASEPPTDFDELDRALRELDRVEWIAYTSVNTVAAVFARAKDIGMIHSLTNGRRRAAAVGRSTAASLARRGVRVDFVPAEPSGSALAAALPIQASESVLLPRSDLASTDAPDMLRARGARVIDVIAYRTVRPLGPTATLPSRRIDAILFASTSAVDAFADAVSQDGAWRALMNSEQRPMIVAIGPRTAHTVHERGWAVDQIAPTPTTDGLLDALAQAFSSRGLHGT